MRILAVVTVLALAVAPAIAQGRVTELKNELKRKERAAKTDTEALLSVAQWAQDHGLTTDSRRLLEKVLEADPANETAHLMLGHVQFEGEWVTREQATEARTKARRAEFEERGWVEVAGVWVAPDRAEDAKKGVFWDGGQRVSRREKLSLNAGMVRHPITGQLIDASDLDKANSGQFPLDGDRWGSEKEADEYHADPQHPWVYRSQNVTLVSNKSLAQLSELAADVDSGCEAAMRVFMGAQPSPEHRPVVLIAENDEQYRRFGETVGAEGSAFSVFFSQADLEIPGYGPARPAVCSWNTDWIRYWIRHAAAFAYVESMLLDCEVEAPLWFRRGVAGYGERFFKPDIAAWFGQQFLEAGGFKRLQDWFGDFAIHGGLEWRQMDASIFQAALLLAYAMDGGDAQVAEALQALAQAVQAKDQRAVDKAMKSLEKQLQRAEKSVREYLGRLTQ